MIITGSFEVTATPEAPFEVVDGVSIGRVHCDKRFSGPLAATSQVTMLGVRTKAEGSAGYVAVERITGALEGKRGTFVVLHTGLMTRGAMSLSLVVVADSGTGELTGISGKMNIRIEEGKHFYDFDVDGLG